jgi:cysteinyl-tRNA synthetase
MYNIPSPRHRLAICTCLALLVAVITACTGEVPDVDEEAPTAAPLPTAAVRTPSPPEPQPSAAAAEIDKWALRTASTQSRLADVSHWLYLIDVDLEPDVVDRIAASDYDMVVLDFIPSEEDNTNYPMAEVVTQLHEGPHPKLLVAYIDIAEAEEYRTYWQAGWRVGNPEWIAGDDPDGWAGNFPVAYWHDEWREIWLGEGGYLQAILDAGFDGVYLDWVEAYSDENVIEIAERDGVDPLQEMIWWVADIADFTRARRPDFIVIGQNAAELAEHDDYLAAIDPPGDCPLPRTDAEVDTEAYRASLSRPCRYYFDSDPDSPLHASSEEYLHYLTLAQRQGVPIFTVDYALEPENVAWVYETSRALGFVPFVSSRALGRYVEPVP